MEELIIKEHETRENLVKLINECGLPAFLLKSMIKEVYEQLEIIAQQQYTQAQEVVKKIKENNEVKEDDVNGQD